MAQATRECCGPRMQTRGSPGSRRHESGSCATPRMARINETAAATVVAMMETMTVSPSRTRILGTLAHAPVVGDEIGRHPPKGLGERSHPLHEVELGHHGRPGGHHHDEGQGSKNTLRRMRKIRRTESARSFFHPRDQKFFGIGTVDSGDGFLVQLLGGAVVFDPAGLDADDAVGVLNRHIHLVKVDQDGDVRIVGDPLQVVHDHFWPNWGRERAIGSSQRMSLGS